MKLHVYLVFDGDCEAAFDFYQAVFGGAFSAKERFAAFPADQGLEIDAASRDLIMHVSLQINAHTVLMGCDAVGDQSQGLKIGNNFNVSINLSDQAEADRIFAALSADGQVSMPIQRTFWGSYYGLLVDRFGIQWMVNCDLSAAPGRHE